MEKLLLICCCLIFLQALPTARMSTESLFRWLLFAGVLGGIFFVLNRLNVRRTRAEVTNALIDMITSAMAMLGLAPFALRYVEKHLQWQVTWDLTLAFGFVFMVFGYQLRKFVLMIIKKRGYDISALEIPDPKKTEAPKREQENNVKHNVD